MEFRVLYILFSFGFKSLSCIICWMNYSMVKINNPKNLKKKKKRKTPNAYVYARLVLCLAPPRSLEEEV